MKLIRNLNLSIALAAFLVSSGCEPAAPAADSEKAWLQSQSWDDPANNCCGADETHMCGFQMSLSAQATFEETASLMAANELFFCEWTSPAQRTFTAHNPFSRDESCALNGAPSTITVSGRKYDEKTFGELMAQCLGAQPRAPRAVEARGKQAFCFRRVADWEEQIPYEGLLGQAGLDITSRYSLPATFVSEQNDLLMLWTRPDAYPWPDDFARHFVLASNMLKRPLLPAQCP